MVQTYERPAEQPTDQLETPDRSVDRSFFIASQVFYLEYSESINSPQVQIDQQVEGSDSLTLYFEAQNPSESFSWQLVQANNRGRTVTHITTHASGQLSGWKANYDKAGSVTDNQELQTEEAPRVSRGVLAFLLTNPALKEKSAAHAAQRETYEQALAKFSVDHEISMTVRKSDIGEKVPITKVFWDTDKKCYMANILVKVKGESFKKELDNRRNRLKHVGFSTVNMTPRPVEQPKPDYYFQGSLLSARALAALKIKKPAG